MLDSKGAVKILFFFFKILEYILCSVPVKCVHWSVCDICLGISVCTPDRLDGRSVNHRQGCGSGPDPDPTSQDKPDPDQDPTSQDKPDPDPDPCIF